MQNNRLKMVGLSATLVLAVALGAAAFPAWQDGPASMRSPNDATAGEPGATLEPTPVPDDASPAADATPLAVAGAVNAEAAPAAAAPDADRNAPDAGPAATDAGPAATDAGPAATDAGPAAPRAAPAATDAGSAATDAVHAATGTRTSSSAERDAGSSEQERTPAFTRPYDESSGTRIVVSIDKRWLWLIMEGDTMLSAPVAVGMNRGFEFAGRSFHFKTPRGRRTVLRKEPNPVWTVPEWHYYERARQQGLEVVRLDADSRVTLGDGTVIVVRDDDVGRINHFGNFWPFTPGNEIIFDGKVFVPPMNTRQRRVPDALGPYKLDMGNGYLIHGTHIYNEQSVGRAVSHGCVRMNNEDLERLYAMVEPGTVVEIR